MRKLAEKMGFGIAIIAIVPRSIVVRVLGECIGVNSSIIGATQLIGTIIQAIAFVTMVKYTDEVLHS